MLVLALFTLTLIERAVMSICMAHSAGKGEG